MRRSRVPSPAPALYGRSCTSATLTTSLTHSRPPRSTGRLSVTGAGPPSGTNNGSRTSSSTSCLLRRRPEAGAQTPNPSLEGIPAGDPVAQLQELEEHRQRRRPPGARGRLGVAWSYRPKQTRISSRWLVSLRMVLSASPQVDQLSAEPLNVGLQGRHPICVRAAQADFSPPHRQQM